MTTATKMLETSPCELDIDVALLARAIEALEECSNTCTQCADSCLSEGDVQMLAKCIRLNLDCADLCVATSRVISRRTEYDANVTRPALDACVAACASCADECDRHGASMAHCRVCAESCRRCASACRELLDAMR